MIVQIHIKICYIMIVLYYLFMQEIKKKQKSEYIKNLISQCPKTMENVRKREEAKKMQKQRKQEATKLTKQQKEKKNIRREENKEFNEISQEQVDIIKALYKERNDRLKQNEKNAKKDSELQIFKIHRNYLINEVLHNCECIESDSNIIIKMLDLNDIFDDDLPTSTNDIKVYKLSNICANLFLKKYINDNNLQHVFLKSDGLFELYDYTPIKLTDGNNESFFSIYTLFIPNDNFVYTGSTINLYRRLSFYRICFAINVDRKV